MRDGAEATASRRRLDPERHAGQQKARAVPPGFMAIIPGMILFKFSTSNNQPMSTRPPMRITAALAAREKYREPVRVCGRVACSWPNSGRGTGDRPPNHGKPAAPIRQRKENIPSWVAISPDLGTTSRKSMGRKIRQPLIPIVLSSASRRERSRISR